MNYVALAPSAAYLGLQGKLERGTPLLMDGAVGTEVARWEPAGSRRDGWGTWAVYRAREAVSAVHRAYARAGSDVVSTNSWAILEAAKDWEGRGPSPAWASAVDAALALARDAVRDAGRDGDCAVAFCINGDLGGGRALGALELLTWRWQAGDAPDLVIFETLPELPDGHVMDAVALVADTGLPVWVSLRRVAGAMARADGTAIPDGGGADLASAAAALTEAGVGALLTNCVPIDRAAAAVGELASVADVPVGCMPNHGTPVGDAWCRHGDMEPEHFALAMLECIESGAQIVGGCCGVGAEHIAAARRRLDSAAAWSARGV